MVQNETEEEKRERRLTEAMSQTSISSKASVSAFAREHTFGGERRGKMRNLIEVDILTVDTRPYKTNFTQEMAYNEIYRGLLNMPKENIHGIKCSWRGHPFITIKLANCIDIDELPAKFDYYRIVKEDDGVTGQYKICGEIKGVRTLNPSAPTRKPERWLRIDPDCYDMEEELLLEWLNLYGTPLTKLEEDNCVVPAFDEDPDEEAGAGEVKLGKGLLSIKIQLEKPIPEFLPIDGKRVRIYYAGMHKQCVNCYQYGHIKAECKEERATWLEYVAGFIKNNLNIRKELFGRWYGIVERKMGEILRPPISSLFSNELTPTNKTPKEKEQTEANDLNNEADEETEYETGDDEDGQEAQMPVAALAEKFDPKSSNKETEPPTCEKRGRGRPRNDTK